MDTKLRQEISSRRRNRWLKAEGGGWQRRRNLTITVSESIRNAIEELAASEDRGISSMMSMLVVRELRRREEAEKEKKGGSKK